MIGYTYSVFEPAIRSWNIARQPPSLVGPLLKIDRAQTHIESLRTGIERFLKGCGYQFQHTFEGDPPVLVVVVKEVLAPPVPPHFSLLAGEAIYQLRTSLDHLVHELIRANGEEPTRNNSWPIHSKQNSKEFERQLIGTSTKAKRRIESLQPYHKKPTYCEHFLWQLKKLNDWDKHNFLIRAFLTKNHGFSVEWSDNSGKVMASRIDMSTELEPGREFQLGPADIPSQGEPFDIKSDPEMVLEMPKVIEGFDGFVRPAFPLLMELHKKVEAIVLSFEDSFEPHQSPSSGNPSG